MELENKMLCNGTAINYLIIMAFHTRKLGMIWSKDCLKQRRTRIFTLATGMIGHKRSVISEYISTIKGDLGHRSALKPT